MERSWSKAALEAFEAYPWANAQEKMRARKETELVSFGEQVEVDDLPLAVRHRLKRDAAGMLSTWTWNGESWKELTEGFEKTILSQVLAEHGGFVSKAARALRTTQRIISYKARKYGISTKQNTKVKEEKDK